MTYNPEQYWPERARRQGRRYVAKSGRWSQYERQTSALEAFLWALSDAGRVLDFGCGPGRFQYTLEAMGLDYEGVDLIPGYGTMEVEDVEPGTFDAVLATVVLQHIVDEGEYRDAVRLIHDALVPGGHLLLIDRLPDANVEWAPHMRPRGVQGVVGVKPWSGSVRLGTWEAHGVWLLTK